MKTDKATHFEREELYSLINRARELAEIEGLNTEWKWAYENLAFAASTLDAFIARSIVKESSCCCHDESEI